MLKQHTQVKTQTNSVGTHCSNIPLQSCLISDTCGLILVTFVQQNFGGKVSPHDMLHTVHWIKLANLVFPPLKCTEDTTFFIVKTSYLVQKCLTSLADSTRTWSYSLSATRNIIDVTFSKQWIHFLLSDLWPPTSTILENKQWSWECSALSCDYFQYHGEQKKK